MTFLNIKFQDHTSKNVFQNGDFFYTFSMTLSVAKDVIWTILKESSNEYLKIYRESKSLSRVCLYEPGNLLKVVCFLSDWSGTVRPACLVQFKGTNGRQKTYVIFHVYCIFYSGFICQTTVIFGITKDGSLESNNLASWNCFTCRNLFQNGANDISECLTFETAFCNKGQNFVWFGSSDFDQISPPCG